MITTRLVVIIQWYCSYHPVLSFDVWLHWNRITVTEALKKVCDEFNWPFSNCRYGFLCREHEEHALGEHLTLLPTNPLYTDEIPKHISCNWQQPTALSKAHTVWFEDVQKNAMSSDNIAKVPSQSATSPPTSANNIAQSKIISERNDKPTLQELSLLVIHQYASHWKDLGALLGLEDYHIANIAKDYHSHSVDACREMLMLWLRDVPSPTWGKLADAITSLNMVLASNPSD